MWVSPEILNWFSRNAGSYYNTEDDAEKLMKYGNMQKIFY